MRFYIVYDGFIICLRISEGENIGNEKKMVCNFAYSNFNVVK